MTKIFWLKPHHSYTFSFQKLKLLLQFPYAAAALSIPVFPPQPSAEWEDCSGKQPGAAEYPTTTPNPFVW